jgi:tetratricopeptide (TPR) repeat protein
LQKEQITAQLMKDLANNHPELSFEQVLTMVKKTLPNDYVPLMNIYALHVKKLRHVQDAFEYANLFRQVDLLDKMIDTHKTDELLEDWVEVYRLFSKFLKQEVNADNFIHEAKILYGKTQNNQLRMRLDIAQLNYYDILGSINNQKPLIEQFKSQFAVMESGFLKSALAIRVTLLAGNAYLFGDGDFETAEGYYLAASVVDSIPDALLVTSYHGLGLIYLKDDKQRCLEAHEKALFYSRRAKIIDYEKKLLYDYIPFVKNMLGETFEIKNVVPKEQAHQYVIRGEMNKALEIINELELKGNTSKAHLLFYKAKATKSVPLFFKSIQAFSAEGYTHMIEYVLKEINKIKPFKGDIL